MWMSHVALLMAGIGLLSGRRVLTSGALVAVVVPHTVWLIDAAGVLLGRGSPMGITRYLEGAELGVWLGTLHHFYLLPLLLIITLRWRLWHRGALLMAVSVGVLMTFLSRVLLSPESNVNYAYNMLGAVDHPLIRAMNGLPAPLYLLALFVVVCGFMYLPTAILLGAWCKSRTPV